MESNGGMRKTGSWIAGTGLLLAALACGIGQSPANLQATVEGAAQNYEPTLAAQLTAAGPTLAALETAATQHGPEVWAMETAAVQTADALRYGSSSDTGSEATTTSEQPAATLQPPAAASTEPPPPPPPPSDGATAGYTGGDEHDTVFVDTLVPGTPRTATVESAFDAHDWIFGVQAGGTISLSATTTGSTDVVITLLDPTGAVVKRVDSGADGVPESLSATVTQAGTYTARITTWTTGEYTISLSLQ
jgi:hypothetical protein